MSEFKLALHNAGIGIYQNNIEINEKLYNTLEKLYNSDTSIDGKEYLRIIYSELCEEVDDEDFYDLDYYNDCEDITNVLLTYCNRFKMDNQVLAVNFGEHVIMNSNRYFNSYEELHQAITTILHQSATNDKQNSYVFEIGRAHV